MDAAYRAPLPYLTLIGAVFGVNAASAGGLAVALSAAGLVAPVVGIVERGLGRRTMTIVATAIFIAVCVLMPFAPTFSAVLLLYLALGIAKSLFTPQVQAFVGDVVAYEKRGTAIGFIELSWALGWIVGVPIFGFLLDAFTWWSPFVLFGLAGWVGLLLVLRFAIVRDAPTAGASDQAKATLFDWANARRVWSNRPAVLMLAFGMLISFTAQLATLTYAPWLIGEFGLTASQLGLASVVLGIADVVAEVATIVLVDRVGKRRAVLVSTALYAASFVLVIAFSRALGPLLVALFIVFLTFEFALVASLAVTTEVVPEARSAMSGFVVATHSFGRIVASLIALPLFGAGGLIVVMTIAAAFTALAVAAYWPVRLAERSGE